MSKRLEDLQSVISFLEEYGYRVIAPKIKDDEHFNIICPYFPEPVGCARDIDVLFSDNQDNWLIKTNDKKLLYL